MDKLTYYRRLLPKLIDDYEKLYNTDPSSGTETFALGDELRDRYMLASYGWTKEGRRIRRPILFVHLRDGKFRIEEDWTEEGIASKLLREGVPQEDIVLAFHPPERRLLTEFAIA